MQRAGRRFEGFEPAHRSVEQVHARPGGGGGPGGVDQAFDLRLDAAGRFDLLDRHRVFRPVAGLDDANHSTEGNGNVATHEVSTVQARSSNLSYPGAGFLVLGAKNFMMRNTLLLFWTGLMLVSCRSNVPPAPPYVPVAPTPTINTAVPPIVQQPVTPAPPSLAGPTVMSRVPGGYELKNDRVRVVISEASGDVTFWGSPTGRNLLLQPGITARLTGQPVTTPTGYFEPRDTETWQFFGSDANHITWRKIYCLDGFNLLASYLYQNDTPGPVSGAVQLVGTLAGVRVQQHAIDHFAGVSTFGTISMTAFNENHMPCTQPSFPVLLQSDTRSCPHGDRLSFTTQWTLMTDQN